MKFTPMVNLGLIVGVLALAGCQHDPSLEESRALCNKLGGFLVVIYSQKISTAGLGPQIASPGDCIPPSKFDAKPAAPLPPTRS